MRWQEASFFYSRKPLSADERLEKFVRFRAALVKEQRMINRLKKEKKRRKK